MGHPHVLTCISVKDMGHRVRLCVWDARETYSGSLSGFNLGHRPLPPLPFRWPRPNHASLIPDCYRPVILVNHVNLLSRPFWASFNITVTMGGLTQIKSVLFHVHVVFCIWRQVEHVRPCKESDPSVLNNLMMSHWTGSCSVGTKRFLKQNETKTSSLWTEKCSFSFFSCRTFWNSVP